MRSEGALGLAVKLSKARTWLSLMKFRARTLCCGCSFCIARDICLRLVTCNAISLTETAWKRYIQNPDRRWLAKFDDHVLASEAFLTERCEKPPVLATCVPLLQSFLNRLLGLLSLRHLFESVVGDHALQTFKFKSVSGGHEVIVIDSLDERLDPGPLGSTRLRHFSSDR